MRQGETIGERFEIERLAGSGGMGEVYRARDRQTGGPVAVKVLRRTQEHEAARFSREAEVLFGLHHPRIVRYVADGTTRAGALYLVTEWLEGEELEQRLTRGALTVAETITLGVGIAEALGAAHRQSVIHRDIKPSNIFLVEGKIEGVKVLDFGIARLGAGASTARALTRTGMLIGTPGFMSPEQARGDKQIDPYTDVFSLGCVLFNCLTGKRPFSGGEVLAVLLKIVFEDAPRLGDLAASIPEALDDLIGQMLSKIPSNRPANGDAVARALAAIDIELADRAPRTSRMESWLTDTERRVMCVVLARLDDDDSLLEPPSTLPDPDGAAGRGADRSPTGPLELITTPFADTVVQLAALEGVIASHGANLATLADGSLLITAPDIGAFTNQVTCAGRAALALRAVLPGATIALAAGRGEMHVRLPVGEVIERGVALLKCKPPAAEGTETGEAAGLARAGGGTIKICAATAIPAPNSQARPVRIDEVIAGFLATSFEVEGDDDGLCLLRERDVEAARTLLGRPTPCVGRERELATMRSVFHEVVSEPAARAIRVIGASGIGKSRLRQEFVSELRAQGIALELWMGRGDPMRAGSPFGVLAPALRRAAGILDGEPLLVRRRKLRARAGRHLSGDHLARVTEFLGEIIGTPFPNEGSLLLRAAREDSRLMGDQMLRAFEDFVAAETAAQPLLIVLEDLEWGDLPSLQFIDGVLRNLADQPLLVFAVARPEIDQTFPNLWAGRPLTDLKLSGLTRRGSERLVREMLGDSVDAAMVERIFALTDGNAFYLEELIRAVAEGKGTQLPDTVLAMVEGRLTGLTHEERRVLRAASVFGHVFWHGGVLALLGGEEKPASLQSILDDLVEHELIQRRPDTKFPRQQEFTFRHALIREAAYAMLTDADRALGHRLAGAWLERAGESDAAVLAEHFERGGQLGRAISAYRRAAAQALDGNDLLAALAWADRGLGCAGGPEIASHEADLGALRLVKIEAHRWRGEFALAEACAIEAIEKLPRGSHGWHLAAGEIAMLSGRLGHSDRLDAIGRELLDLWSNGAESVQIVATARAATFLLLEGGYALADALFDNLKRIQDREKDPSVRARIHQALARRALIAGDPGAYIRHTAAAADCCEQAGDLRRMCVIQGNLGFAQIEVGAYEHAERALRAALTLAAQLGLPNLTANTKHNLGLVLAHLGVLDEALRVEMEAVDIASSQGDHRLISSSRSCVAMILHLQGALPEAEREAAAAASTPSIAPPVQAFALATLANVRISMGKTIEALHDATEAHRIFNALGGIEVGEALIRLVHAEALHANGNHGAAIEAITAASTRLLARADKLDGTFREGFITRVPENARTLVLARSWTPVS